jgi:hypothetical protein
MRTLLLALLSLTLAFSCNRADAAPDTITIHYVHPNSETICRVDPGSKREGYRLMKVVMSDQKRESPVLVGKEIQLADEDIKEIQMTVSSVGVGCDIIFKDVLRDKLQTLRLNDRTGKVAVVVGGDTLVSELSTQNISGEKLFVQIFSKAVFERLSKHPRVR